MLARTIRTAALAALAALAAAAAPAAPPAAPAPAAPPDLDTIVRRLDDLYRSKTSIAVIEMTIATAKTTRTLRMKAWSKGEDKALIVIEAPPREAGTATLKVGDNLWNYLPRVSRTIRVPPAMMRGSWMGTDFTNDDLVKESSFKRDYTTRLVGPSPSPEGWLVEMVAKPGVVGLWERMETVVSKDGTYPIVARYYDRKGRLARTMTSDEVRLLGGRMIPAHLTLTSTDEPDHKTEMRYVELAFDVDVPDATFSLSSLERPR